MLKTIIHLADIHIGHADRTDEYRKVFDNLRDSIDSYPVASTCIVISGDIFHNKIKYSSDDILLFNHLMSILAKFNVVIIPGNHDTNLNNASQIDLISPLVAQYKNVKYSKNTETFRIMDREFYHYSIYGGEFNINLVNGSVLLYHGCVDGLYNNSSIITKDVIACAHIAALGDIHEHQFLLPNAAYPGSLIQQNVKEVPPKGFIVWNVTTRTGQFVEVVNPYGFVKINVVNNNIVNFPTRFPEHIRSLCINSKEPISDKIRAEIEKRCGRKIDKISKPIMRFDNSNIENVMRENDVYEIYQEIAKTNIINQTEWHITYMKWDNFYAFGSGNCIDFTQLGKLTGIIAPNMSGKSSIIDLIIFGLFGEPIRGTKQTIINKDERSALLYIEFIVNLAKYSIDIAFSKGKYTKVLLMRDGVNISAQTVPETYTKLSGILGTYNELLASAVCLQDDDYNIIRMTRTKRRDILSRLFGLSGIDAMLATIKEKMTEIKNDAKVVVQPRIADPQSELTKCLAEITSLEQSIAGASRDKRSATVVTKELARIPEFDDDMAKELASLEYKDAPLYPVTEPANKRYMHMEAAAIRAYYDKNIPVYEKWLKKLDGLTRMDLTKLKEQADKASSLKFDPVCSACQHNKHRVGLSSNNAIADYNKALEYNASVDAEEKELREKLQKQDLKLMLATLTYKLYQNKRRAEELTYIKSQQPRRAALLQELAAAPEIDISEVSMRLGSLKARADTLRNEIKIKENYDSIMPLLDAKLTKYKKLKSLIGEKGMQANMVYEYMKTIIEQCNKILSEIANFNVAITPYLDFTLDNNLPLEMGSGFQKFIISIVFRLVLTQVLPASAKFLIIDEGFGCMDEHNIAKMPKFLEAIMNITNLQYIIIISHVAELNETVDAKLVIKMNNNRAHISNTVPRLPVAAAAVVPAAQASEPKKARTVSKKVSLVDESQVADAVIPVGFYECSCGKILKKVSKKTHERSAYHLQHSKSE